MRKRDVQKYRGCFVGAAIGDALGYAVDGMDMDEIRAKYGEEGITKLELQDGEAPVSDNFQLAMFTAEGLMYGLTRETLLGNRLPYDMLEAYVYDSYKNWLVLQKEADKNCTASHQSWLVEREELARNRTSGNSRLAILKSGRPGSICQPTNDDKGSGCLYGSVPVGLLFDRTEENSDTVCHCGAKIAALTQGNPAAFISAAVFADLINRLQFCEYDDGSPAALENMVLAAIGAAEKVFGSYTETELVTARLTKAVDLAHSDVDTYIAIETLGSGRDAETALAIGFYCALKYSANYMDAIIAAVNHSGGSAPTGMVAGAILGSYYALKGIHYTLLSGIELRFVIQELADDIYDGMNQLGNITGIRPE
jgi:ADP-ribosylglycohydrolase